MGGSHLSLDLQMAPTPAALMAARPFEHHVRVRHRHSGAGLQPACYWAEPLGRGCRSSMKSPKRVSKVIDIHVSSNRKYRHHFARLLILQLCHEGVPRMSWSSPPRNFPSFASLSTPRCARNAGKPPKSHTRPNPQVENDTSHNLQFHKFHKAEERHAHRTIFFTSPHRLEVRATSLVGMFLNSNVPA